MTTEANISGFAPGGAATDDDDIPAGPRFEWPQNVPLIPTLHSDGSKFANPNHPIWRTDPRHARIRLKIKWRSRDFVMVSDYYPLDAKLEDIAASWGGLRHDERYMCELVKVAEEGFGCRRVWTSQLWGSDDAPADRFPIREWKVLPGQSGELPEDVKQHLRTRAELVGKCVDGNGVAFDPADGSDQGADYPYPNEPPTGFPPPNGYGAPNGYGTPAGPQPPFQGGGFPGAPPGYGANGYGAAPGYGQPSAAPGYGAPSQGYAAPGMPFQGQPHAMPFQAPAGYGAAPAPPPPPPGPPDIYGGLPHGNGFVYLRNQWVPEAAYFATLHVQNGFALVLNQWVPLPQAAPPPPPPGAPPAVPGAPAVDNSPVGMWMQLMTQQQQTERERIRAEGEVAKAKLEADARHRDEAETRRREDEKIAREERIRAENQRREDEKAAREERQRLEDQRRDAEVKRQEAFMQTLMGAEAKRNAPTPPSPEQAKWMEMVETLNKTIAAAKEGPKEGKDRTGIVRGYMKGLREDLEALGMKLPGFGGGKDDDDDKDTEAARWEKTIDRLIPLAERVTGMGEVYFGKELREADTNAAKYQAEAKKAELDVTRLNAELAASKAQAAQAAVEQERLRLERDRQQYAQQQQAYAQQQQPFYPQQPPVYPQQPGGFAPQPGWPAPAHFAPTAAPMGMPPQPTHFAPPLPVPTYPQPSPLAAPAPAPQFTPVAPPSDVPRSNLSLGDEVVSADALLDL